MPADTPLTTPLVDTVAEPVLLLQVPPLVTSVNDTVLPTHTLAVLGVIATGVVFTLNVLVV